ncbi:MAG: helix-turn-helix domain-containing protein [Bifidobacteriaceae bacterium]|jgi:DNA-binding IclR family transcriptional regulator|nr:helix-turn-helix domain-containing protein [Bifidobacteriaceae bacterium]
MTGTGSGYQSLKRGLAILATIQDVGPMRTAEIATRLGTPLSSTYRYVSVLSEAGFAVEVDGVLVPSDRLTSPNEGPQHIVRACGPVLRGLRNLTGLTAALAVRVHTVALCLEVVFAHPQHRISFHRGQSHGLHAGGSALPLLAFAPRTIIREIAAAPLRRFTAHTPTREDLAELLPQIRRDGYAISHGHLTPGMSGFGVPLLVDGRCLCALSLIGDSTALARAEELVGALKRAAAELLARLASNGIQEAWSQPND